ncbi:MAG: phytoene/squalene synthase family protein [Candidatus Kapabacteria bacterium]|nr:phytoene/squalene synthase family protein [Candidatus Kapabacteria bacterium]
MLHRPLRSCFPMRHIPDIVQPILAWSAHNWNSDRGCVFSYRDCDRKVVNSKLGNVQRAVMLDQQTAAAYDVCQRVTRTHAKTFYAASHFIPADKRNACYAVYAFCRYVDDIVDVAMERGDVTRADAVRLVEQWRSEVSTVYSGNRVITDGPVDPAQQDRAAVLLAWEDTLQKYSIPPNLPEELIEGVLMDTTITRFATYDELAVYCYKVASVVGLMTSEIFGYSSPDALSYAVDLGIAMQLTNIIRDVKEDAVRGRIYLAKEDMDLFEVSEADILESHFTPNVRGLIAEYIRRADVLYSRADVGIAMLEPSSMVTVLLMSRNYQKILRAVEKMDYNVFLGRASIGPLAKLMAVPSAYFEARRLRRAQLK